MNCTNCGNPIPAGNTFCGNCGTPVGSNPNPAPVQPAQPVDNAPKEEAKVEEQPKEEPKEEATEA